MIVKPPGLLMPGTKTSSHCPGRNWSSWVNVSAVVLLAPRGHGREHPGGAGTVEGGSSWIERCHRPTNILVRIDAGALTLMLPTDGGMPRRKVRIEGLTSSICLRMTVWSDC